jgi:DNA polymerase-1
MAKASAIILAGFGLRSEARIVCYPERYVDGRGVKMWNTVWNIIRQLEN